MVLGSTISTTAPCPPANWHASSSLSGPNGITGGLITKQEVHFDALGRVHLERDWRGGTAWNTVETRYDAMGNKTDVSTPYAGASATGWTQLNDYDPFGRAEKIVTGRPNPSFGDRQNRASCCQEETRCRIERTRFAKR